MNVVTAVGALKASGMRRKRVRPAKIELSGHSRAKVEGPVASLL